jgi:hypothetical protein
MSKTTFSFSVFVDNNPLKEYEIVDETYIEANLHAKSSYIIKEIDDDGYTQVKHPIFFRPKLSRFLGPIIIWLMLCSFIT